MSWKCRGFQCDPMPMIFLDTDEHYLVTDTRREMVATLLAHLDPGTVDLAALAAACLGCREEDVVVVET